MTLLQDRSFCNPGTLSGNFGSKEIQGEVMGKVWSLVEFYKFFGSSILAENLPLAIDRGSLLTPSRILRVIFLRMRVKSFHVEENTVL